jgi:hypothetical protein
VNSTTPRQNQKVCFICGAPHSGSTLLGLVLGSHPASFYLGESKNIRFWGDVTIPERKRACKLCGLNCPIWKDFHIDADVDVYEQLAKITQKPVIIDSVKQPAWLRQQIQILENTTAELFLIFLQRDGRAVINSRIRKNPAQDAQAIIADWMAHIEATAQLFDAFAGAKIKMHCEALATRPAEVIQELCGFLKLPYQPEMLNYTRRQHHPLGGNAGTQFLVSRAQRDQQKPTTAYLEAQHAYYLHRSPEITLDLRWKQELDPAVERLFEKLAGHLNADLRREEES